jgi:hypothetical protein
MVEPVVFYYSVHQLNSMHRLVALLLFAGAWAPVARGLAQFDAENCSTSSPCWSVM